MPDQTWKTRDPLVINAGDLRHAIQIQAPADAPDSRGLSITPASWTTVRSCFANIATAGGRETSQASQIVSQVSYVVKVRWTPTVIKANYRILFRDRAFVIQYVENVLERNRVLNLYCVEIDGGGQ